MPFDDLDARKQLTQRYHTPLKQPHGGPSIVVVSADPQRDTVNRDATDKVIRTHDETGQEFPWQVGAAEGCCAVATTCVLCTIL